MNNTDRVATIPVQSIGYYGATISDHKRGIYTGFSPITGKHHFSLFDGSTTALDSLDSAVFDDPKHKAAFISQTL